MTAADLSRYEATLSQASAYPHELENLAWAYQYAYNPVIRTYADRIGVQGPVSVPISFFKHMALKTGDWEAETWFESSGTTGQSPSRHLVRTPETYIQQSLKGFFQFFPRQSYRILALLPSYLERGQSSLVYMVRGWMDQIGLPGSGFYLYNHQALAQAISEAGDAGEPILLIGVSYALLDFAEAMPMHLPPGTIVMETGGMKGRREELIRDKLHARLCDGLGISTVASEYGMTELLSQAYATAQGRFYPTTSLRAWVSDIHLDRLEVPHGVTGRLHLVDLANIHTCAFIATDDLARMYPDGSFEVLGRLDQAEARGCSLMYA
ncbi:MAG: acyl transferase [Bacteroidia bacterium]|nr:acyl transferase [Bacteroidia bacterium]